MKKEVKKKNIYLSEKDFQILHKLVSEEKINIELLPNNNILDKSDSYTKELRQLERKLLYS